MKPAPFRYVAARTLEQALQLKAEYGDEAHFLAGGQSLVPTMNFRLTQPSVLIDINPLTKLAGVWTSAPDSVRVGALTRYGKLERDPGTARDLPLIHEALPHIAHPQIRNRGTIGGNLAHADPASEMPAIVLTLAGKALGATEIGDAAALVQRAIDPGGSIHASKEFQRHVAGVLTARALIEANQRARREH